MRMLSVLIVFVVSILIWGCAPVPAPKDRDMLPPGRYEMQYGDQTFTLVRTDGGGWYAGNVFSTWEGSCFVNGDTLHVVETRGDGEITLDWEVKLKAGEKYLTGISSKNVSIKIRRLE